MGSAPLAASRSRRTLILQATNRKPKILIVAISGYIAVIVVHIPAPGTLGIAHCNTPPEHVGYKNYWRFFEIANKCLIDDGIFLLHTIGNNISEKELDQWTDKYIFPNRLLPSVT